MLTELLIYNRECEKKLEIIFYSNFESTGKKNLKALQ